MMMIMMMILSVDKFVDNPSIIFPQILLGATPHLKRFVIVVVISLSGFRFVVGFGLWALNVRLRHAGITYTSVV